MEAVKEAILFDIMKLLRKSGAVIPKGSKMFLSHHFGLPDFSKFGAAVIECFNLENYAKKVLILLAGQFHVQHFHDRKHETFHVLYGDLRLIVGSNSTETTYEMGPGDLQVVSPKMKHSFSTINGCVFEEISTHQFEGDSVYEQELSKDRKTLIRVFV